MEYLLTAEEMAQADMLTSEEIGIPSLVLMERAALAVAEAVMEDFSAAAPERSSPTGSPARDSQDCSPAAPGSRSCGKASSKAPDPGEVPGSFASDSSADTAHPWAGNPSGRGAHRIFGRRPRCAVVAGKGNNGADAVAAGRMLVDAGYEVRFYLVSRDTAAGGSIDVMLCQEERQTFSSSGTAGAAGSGTARNEYNILPGADASGGLSESPQAAQELDIPYERMGAVREGAREKPWHIDDGAMRAPARETERGWADRMGQADPTAQMGRAAQVGQASRMGQAALVSQADQAAQVGRPIRVDQADPASLKPLSSMDTQLHIIRAYGIEPLPFTQQDFVSYRPEIILDGLFGTGLSRKVGEPYASAIRLINQAREGAGSRVYSVDIPSGVDGTTGEILGTAVQADVTVTFAFYKRGHFLYPGCEKCGRLLRKDIGITRRSLRGEPGMFTYRTERAGDLLPARSGAGNKGTFGKVLVAAGSRGVSGACTMCAQAVLRMGAGMVKVVTHEDNRVILQQTVPEAMCRTYDDAKEDFGRFRQTLREDLAWADVAAVGPGLGRTEYAGKILAEVLDYAAGRTDPDGREDGRAGFGLVIDADAVRLIAQYQLYERLRAAGRRSRVILTPHMAECAALFRMDIAQLQEEKLVRAREFAELYSCTLCLKDARTLVASPDSRCVYLNTSGNDGLATAGSGDVLTGIAAACLAQGMEAFPAACAASYLHGCAAERITRTMDRRSLMATDLIAVLAEETA